MIQKSININESLSLFDDHWSPKIIGSVNNQEVKLAKILGSFEWHSHKDSDEMFFVLEGEFTMEYRDDSTHLKKGDMIIVPKGVEHRPVAEKECSVMLVETCGLINTGDAPPSERTTKGTWITNDY